MAVKALTSTAKVKEMKSKLRQAVGSGASMVPADKTPPPPPKEEERVPELRELIEDKAEQRQMKQMVADYLTWSRQEKEAAGRKKEISDAMKKIVGSYGISKVMVADNLVNYFNAPRSTIKAELLLSNGVSPGVIEASTQVTPVYTLRITPPKE